MRILRIHTVGEPPDGPANRKRRLGLARLAWLGRTGQLRGPAGQAAVLEACRARPSWRPLLGGDTMLLPDA